MSAGTRRRRPEALAFLKAIIEVYSGAQK